MPPPRIAVTTSADPDELAQERAKAAAGRWGVPLLPRRHKRAFRPMLGDEADALIVFGKDGAALWDLHGSLKFHPGVARLRLRRLDRGEMDDAFLRVAELREGERVLDCTLGLGQDAPLSAEVLERAKRVAARCVVVKGWRYSRELKRLGIQPVLLSRFADVAWARVDAR